VVVSIEIRAYSGGREDTTRSFQRFAEGVSPFVGAATASGSVSVSAPRHPSRVRSQCFSSWSGGETHENPLGRATPRGRHAWIWHGRAAADSYCLRRTRQNIPRTWKARKPEHLRVFRARSEPLHFSVLAFHVRRPDYVTADSRYEAGMRRVRNLRSPIAKNPADENVFANDNQGYFSGGAGRRVFYVVYANTPTGTMTPHSSIEQLLGPSNSKGSVVLVD